MPAHPRKSCNRAGCPALVEYGQRYCQKHKKQLQKELNSQRKYQHLYGSGRWKRERAIFLKEKPLCVECLKVNRYVAANVVDHKVPHKGDEELFWNKDNWQPLCTRCHNIATVKYDGGFGNKVKEKGVLL